MLLTLRLSFISLVILSSHFVNADEAQSTFVKPFDNKVEWGYLNPLRGENSPKALNLWGDRTTSGATGMLVKFKPDFSSPPHIHNVAYRAVVISGSLHNDDPTAQPNWMTTGSFWTQPAGSNHITAANSAENMIYLEIDEGPYLVKPPQQQFATKEQPLNLHWSNIAWVDSHQSKMLSGSGIALSKLWQSSSGTAMSGYFLKVAANTSVNLKSESSQFKAVVINGNIEYEGQNTTTSLKAGSLFSSEGVTDHRFTTQSETVLYIRTNDVFKVIKV